SFAMFSAYPLAKQQRAAFYLFQEALLGYIGYRFIRPGIVKLAFISLYSLHFPIKGVADIYYKAGFYKPVLYYMKYTLWPPGLLLLPVFCSLYFPEAGQETGVGYQFSGSSMVWVAVFKGVGYHYIRLVFTYIIYQFQLVLFIILEKTVSHTRIFAYAYSHQAGGIMCLLQAYLGRSPGSQFSLGQVQYAYGLSHLCMFNDSTGAA